MVAKETSLCAEIAALQAGLGEALARWDLRRTRPGRSSLRDPECHLGPRKVVRPFGLVLGRALDPDVPTVSLDDLLGDRQAEPCARRALIADPVGVEEGAEHILALAGQETFALVINLEEQGRGVAAHPHQHLPPLPPELD